MEWKTGIFFIDPQRTKVNQKKYIEFLKTSLLPECRRLRPDNDFVFMQDSAPTHRTKATQDFLRDNARFHQLTRMDTAFARIESARLLSLGYLERICLQTSKIFRMLSEPNGLMPMTRQ